MKHWTPAAESFLALVLVCVAVVPAILHGSWLEQFSPAWLFAWLFAISGVRRAQGAARLAAIASLTVLVCQAAGLVLAVLLAGRQAQ